MANTPKKMKDPTEAALSAIQDALNVRDPEPATDAADAAAAPPAPDHFPPETAAAEPAWRSRPLGGRVRRPGRALEDAATMRRPPTTTASRSARFCGRSSAARPHVLCGRDRLRRRLGAGGIALGLLYLPELKASLGPSGLSAPILGVLAMIFFAPIIFFFVLAHMVWRSQELRLIAQSMAEVAMRLAEPETVARESIVTVGQAIRREVAAMGDGVERALARAAELETLVANEVSALERAYNDNEVRIRGLLQDLGKQRDTLVGQAEQVRDAITSVHLDLAQRHFAGQRARRRTGQRGVAPDHARRSPRRASTSRSRSATPATP